MRIRSFAPTVALLVPTAGLGAQSAPPAASGYLTPPPAIVQILGAEPLPGVTVSPARDVLAVVPRRSMPSIAELAQPMSFHLLLLTQGHAIFDGPTIPMVGPRETADDTDTAYR